MQDSLKALELTEERRRALVRRSCQNAGGTVADWKIMSHLGKNTLSMRQLSDLSNLDLSTLSRQLTKSIERELIIREPKQQDQRLHFFKSTPKGLLFMKEVNEQIRIFDQKLFENWSAEEQSMFNILINRILKKAQK